MEVQGSKATPKAPEQVSGKMKEKPTPWEFPMGPQLVSEGNLGGVAPRGILLIPEVHLWDQQGTCAALTDRERKAWLCPGHCSLGHPGLRLFHPPLQHQARPCPQLQEPHLREVTHKLTMSRVQSCESATQWLGEAQSGCSAMPTQGRQPGVAEGDPSRRKA